MKKLIGNQGVSLIELITAATVFSFAVASFFSTFSEVSRISKESIQTQRAYQILEGVLESGRFSAFSYQLLPSRDSAVIVDSSLVLQDAKGRNFNASLSVNVFRVNYGGEQIAEIPAKKVQGVLAWEKEKGSTERCTLETVIALTAAVD